MMACVRCGHRYARVPLSFACEAKIHGHPCCGTRFVVEEYTPTMSRPFPPADLDDMAEMAREFGE